MSDVSGGMRFRMIAPAFPNFNIYSSIAKQTTALGPLSVATVVHHMPGWQVEVIDENNFRKYGPKHENGTPDHAILQAIRHADAVGLYGGLSSTINRLHELARFYKKTGAVTIAGGQHLVGENVREALDNDVDYVVIGEGEDTIRELLEAIETGSDPAGIAGIAFLRNGEVVRTADRPPIEDFTRLPAPDFRLLRYAQVKIYPVGWIRGCGMNCEFCTVKGKPRSAPPALVVEHIAGLLEQHGARHFFIVDDLFGHNRRDTLEFCGMLSAYQKAVGTRLNLTVQIRLDRGRDEDLLKAMRQAGVKTVCIGFESPIAEELEAMDKRIKPETMLERTRRFHAAGFFVHGMFIFGYPLPEGASLAMTAKARARRFRRFIRKARLDTIQVLLPVPLPGTALTARLEADGRILSRDCIGWEYYDGNFPLFMPDAPMTPELMQLSLRRIMGRFYRFRYVFAIGLNVLIFPAMFLSVWDIRFGWRKWTSVWRNNLIRFGGWILLKRWTSKLRHGAFSQKLAKAKALLPLPQVAERSS